MRRLVKEQFDVKEMRITFSNAHHNIAKIDAEIYEKNNWMYEPNERFDVITMPCSLNQMIVLKDARIVCTEPHDNMDMVDYRTLIATRDIHIVAQRVEIRKFTYEKKKDTR